MTRPTRRATPADKPTPTATVADRLLQALADLPTAPTAGQLAAHLSVSQSAVTKALATLEQSGRACRSTPDPDRKRAAATWSFTPPPATPIGPETPAAATTKTSGARPAASTTATERLGQGQLRALVLEQLRAQPAGAALTPSQIARALGRSAGAVANACDKLTATGEAHQVGAKPRTFAATGGTSPRPNRKPAKTVTR